MNNFFKCTCFFSFNFSNMYYIRKTLNLKQKKESAMTKKIPKELFQSKSSKVKTHFFLLGNPKRIGNTYKGNTFGCDL